jgi:ADP-ribose pyrophosphatase YjhB (NUDIX family)
MDLYHHHSKVLVNPIPEEELMPSVSVDCVILGFEEEKLKVLLVQHNGGPKDGQWALPGDFIRKDCDLEKMPYEVLQRLTGIKSIFVKQLGAFGAIERVDYRRIITIAYYALVSPQKYILKIGSGAKDVGWFEINNVPELIFDHNAILQFSVDKLNKDIDHEPIGLKLLGDHFTLTQLQKLYEAIKGEKLDTRNFRRKIIKSNILSDTGKLDTSAPYRAPKLFSFNVEKYNEHLKNSSSNQML